MRGGCSPTGCSAETEARRSNAPPVHERALVSTLADVNHNAAADGIDTTALPQSLGGNWRGMTNWSAAVTKDR